MKNYYVFSFLGVILFMMIQNEWMKGLILFLIIIFPFLITFLIESKGKRFGKKEFSENLKFIINVSINLSLIVFAISILSVTLLYKGLDENNVRYFIFNSFYYSFLIFLFLIINYFGTRSDSLRKSIMAFIEAMKIFSSKKLLISILVIVFAIVLRPISKELLIGLVGAYLFFFLMEIDNFYKDNKEDEKNYNKYDIFFQVVINVLLIITLSDFEKLFNLIVYGKTLNYEFWVNIPLHMILFALSITISHCFQYIQNFYKKLCIMMSNLIKFIIEICKR